MGTRAILIEAPLTTTNPVVLFDSNCLLCNKYVQIMLELDKKQAFDFASLSSNFGINLLLKYQISEDSIILWDKGRVVTKSTAVLAIVKILGFPYSILLGFYILPKFMRDCMYDYIASHRKAWFGQTQHCLINLQNYPHRIIF